MQKTSNRTRKRVFIIHGWEASSSSDWFPWLKKELENRGFEVTVPDMPDTERPNKEVWITYLASLIGAPDEQTYLVGHSIGGNTVLRYLESLDNKKIGGAVLVAPYFGKVVLESGEAKKIADPWLNTPIDFSRIKNVCSNLTFIFSDNDEWVPLENKEFFKEKLSPKIIIERGKGHFNEEDDIAELPSALEALLSFS
ncbi:MAG: alpha/beta fold hydrolase [Patescibacteria group bacterium]